MSIKININVSDNELKQHVLNACHSKKETNIILAVRSELAERYLDVIQKMLDDDLNPPRSPLEFAHNIPLPSQPSQPGLLGVGPLPGVPFDRHKLRRFLVKLAETSGVLPPSLFLTGVVCTNRTCVNGGGFADIFHGEYGEHGVALKRLRVFTKLEMQSMSKELCREVLVWRQLHHPNIQTFLGVDRETFNGPICMVSRWRQHGNVLDYMRHLEIASQHASTTQVDQWLLDIAEGLKYLHDERIVHGDLRGPNILIDDNLCVRLTDFGLAVIIDATSRRSNHGGAVRWMAPELLDPDQFKHHSDKPTVASDVYAFACVCIEVYTKSLPFAEFRNNQHVIVPVTKGQRPPRPSARTGRVMNDRVWDIVRACWKHDPLARPSIADVIDRWTTGEETFLHKVLPVSPPSIHQRRKLLRCHGRDSEMTVDYRYEQTYLVGVRWDKLEQSRDNTVLYTTGLNGDSVGASSFIDLAKTVSGFTISFVDDINVKLDKYTVQEADIQQKWKATLPLPGQQTYIYQQRLCFFTRVKHQRCTPTGEQITDRMGLPDDFTFKWHVKCDSIEVVKAPFKGTEKIEAIVRTRSILKHPGARNDVVFRRRNTNIRAHDPGDDVFGIR